MEIGKDGKPQKDGKAGKQKIAKWFQTRRNAKKEYTNRMEVEGDSVVGLFKGGKKKIDLPRTATSCAVDASNHPAQGNPVQGEDATGSDNTIRSKYTYRVTVETLKKDHPWGVDPDRKRASKKECQEIVTDVCRLRGRMKNFKKGGNHAVMDASDTLHKAMKKKSENFRSQLEEGSRCRSQSGRKSQRIWSFMAVSYTHLTLPTKRIV